MQTALNDPDDRNDRRFAERPIIRIVREAPGGKGTAGADRPVAYKWLFGPRRRPDRKLPDGFSLQ